VDQVNDSQFDVRVFFDGACPLCAREINFLRGLDRRNRLRFTDIADSHFDPALYGRSMEAFMAEVHGLLSDGRWITGVEVFRRLYGATRLRPLVGLTRLPGIAQLLDTAYGTFAKNRLRWTGRCTGSCAVRPATGGTVSAPRNS
jgi:predicted DCC family thiol-disulfide oxidoreductase YuxK